MGRPAKTEEVSQFELGCAWVFYFKDLQVCIDIVHVRVRVFSKPIEMGGQRIVDLHLHGASLIGLPCPQGIEDGDGELVFSGHGRHHGLARRQQEGRLGLSGTGAAGGIQHPPQQVQSLKPLADSGQIPGSGVARGTLSLTVEVRRGRRQHCRWRDPRVHGTPASSELREFVHLAVQKRHDGVQIGFAEMLKDGMPAFGRPARITGPILSPCAS